MQPSSSVLYATYGASNDTGLREACSQKFHDETGFRTVGSRGKCCVMSTRYEGFETEKWVLWDSYIVFQTALATA